jgi:hypothetical protein
VFGICPRAFVSWFPEKLHLLGAAASVIPSAKTLLPNEVPGDTAFVKDPIPFRSVEVDHIPIWRPGPMAWVTQLLQVTSSHDPNSTCKDPISK